MRASTPIPTTVIPCAEQVRRIDESLEVGQGHLLLGFRTEKSIRDPENYANVVLNELLGASPTSKLFMNVREKLSLCYHCSSSYNARRGTVTVLCALSGVNRQCAEEEILHQVEEIRQGRFTDVELVAAKQSLLNTYRQAEDSPTALESIYFGRALMAICDTLEDSRRQIGAVSREDVIAAARRLSLDTVYFLDGILGEGEDENEED
jgi:predicted Zn-dependent peptidase